ncbi:MAG: hypothetical protein KJ964_02970 [Verrucomicrobia bacterium]|nr:hypothetical protein [Verrucomicrobiota bacterium]MBU1734171.1 hypothetical protein [Verrucomicrobiota bacterium]MBU1856507.1 hypothetical protein [Verrucomicrobiota bacterium]
MSKALRINIEEEWYHILNRGIKRREIFNTTDDYRHFLELVNKLPERCQATGIRNMDSEVDG